MNPSSERREFLPSSSEDQREQVEGAKRAIRRLRDQIRVAEAHLQAQLETIRVYGTPEDLEEFAEKPRSGRLDAGLVALQILGESGPMEFEALAQEVVRRGGGKGKTKLAQLNGARMSITKRIHDKNKKTLARLSDGRIDLRRKK